MNERPLSPADRTELIEALAFALRYNRSGKRTHDRDGAMAVAAAEHLADALARSGFVVMRGPPAPAHRGVNPAHSTLEK